MRKIKANIEEVKRLCRIRGLDLSAMDKGDFLDQIEAAKNCQQALKFCEEILKELKG